MIKSPTGGKESGCSTEKGLPQVKSILDLILLEISKIISSFEDLNRHQFLSFIGEGLEKEAPLESYPGAWLTHPALGQFRGGVPLSLKPKTFPVEALQTLQHLQHRAAGEAQKRLQVRHCQGGDVQTSRRLLFH